METPPLVLASGAALGSPRGHIWIDTDAACGATPHTDPDDCLAIVWLASRRQNIVGISSSFGNARGDVVEHTIDALVSKISKDGLALIPIWRGSAGPLSTSDFQAQPAHMGLRAELERGPLTILALGPLTNVAAALEGRPDLQRNVTLLVTVMGHRPGHLFHPAEGSGRGILFGHGPIFRDLNFSKDEGAALSILRMHLPISLIPYDAARQVKVTTNDLDKLASLGPSFAWVAGQSRGWLAFWQTDIGQPGFYPFDWAAAAYVVKPEIFDCAATQAWVAQEWAFWLYPRANLLVGPFPPTDSAFKSAVLYCPQADQSLYDNLFDGTFHLK
jgi:purine nucleosidase